MCPCGKALSGRLQPPFRVQQVVAWQLRWYPRRKLHCGGGYDVYLPAYTVVQDGCLAYDIRVRPAHSCPAGSTPTGSSLSACVSLQLVGMRCSVELAGRCHRSCVAASISVRCSLCRACGLPWNGGGRGGLTWACGLVQEEFALDARMPVCQYAISGVVSCCVSLCSCSCYKAAGESRTQEK